MIQTPRAFLSLIGPVVRGSQPLATSLLVALALSGCDGGGKGSTSDGPNQVVSYSDQDGDTIIDFQEGFVDPESADSGSTGESLDSDGDGTADYLDTDSDDDGILDSVEAGDEDPLTLPYDSDEDGIADFRDLDSDENCIADADEGSADLDSDGVLDSSDLDDDGDNIKDLYEIGETCEAPDHDGDGTPDYQDMDSDNDNVADVYESGTSAYDDSPADTDQDGTPDYLDDDSDGDGVSDTLEGGTSSADEAPRDTDGDGIIDSADFDSDGDGLTDVEEAAMGTNPRDSDSDSDGFTDGAEVEAGTDPSDRTSQIDGIYVTVPERTSVEDTFDFTLNVEMGDVMFLIDTTCSMSSTLSGMSSQFSSIVSGLSTALPDAQYGVATFDDYPDGTHGSAGIDKPYILKKQITDDTAAVQSTLSGLGLHSGNDTPESSMEAIYQALSGDGYDMNCDGNYSATTDVVPFMASAGDLFSGSGGQWYDSSTSGGGIGGGSGFRDYALPVVIYATDAQMRDPDSTNASYNGAPRTACLNAGATDVVAAATASGAYLIGISVGGSAPVAQMNTLADRTNSYADTDGDGAADDKLVFTWSGSSTALRTTIVNAVTDLVGSLRFSEVTLVPDDPYGFVVGIDPASYTLSSGANGQVIDFALTFRGAVPAQAEDKVYHVALNVVGDGTVLLDTLDIYIVVPGN